MRNLAAEDMYFLRFLKSFEYQGQKIIISLRIMMMTNNGNKRTSDSVYVTYTRNQKRRENIIEVRKQNKRRSILFDRTSYRKHTYIIPKHPIP